MLIGNVQKQAAWASKMEDYTPQTQLDMLGNSTLWWELLHEISPCLSNEIHSGGMLEISFKTYVLPNIWQIDINQKEIHNKYLSYFIEPSQVGCNAKLHYKSVHVVSESCQIRQSPKQLCDSALLSSSKWNCSILYQLDKGGPIFHKVTALKKNCCDFIYFPRRNLEKL